MRIAILGAALVLAACGDAGEPTREPDVAEPSAMPAVEPSATLEELGEDDIRAARLEGELACAFRRSDGQVPIFLGRGNVLDEVGAVAAVKYGGSVQRLEMEGRGGYDAMADGARFGGQGLTLTIARTGEAPIAEEPQAAMESPIYPATLTFTGPGEAKRVIEGLFECGP
ncbi:hypothetical protein [Pelagerythrobacter aerophilus]|uniref:Lipoprotein n=1 Tax=Pelagerythrobacter aerophilus TaxID=2306995 RepID=A0A418NDA9_9SPHN|nr:hypothetical protein [Pelagerythrobacter aerophilus]RIV75781.1 hypothetical protein D2V04_16040 [Pelagerythrobacter aerophilus]